MQSVCLNRTPLRTATNLRSGHLKTDIELRCVTGQILGPRWYELVSAAPEAEIAFVCHSAASFGVVGGLLVDLICSGFIEVKLRGELVTLSGSGIIAYLKIAYLKMDMDRSPW